MDPQASGHPWQRVNRSRCLRGSASSFCRGGLEPLRRALLAAAKKGTEIAEIRLPAENGKLLAEIYRTGNVLSQRTDDGQIVLRARVDEQLAGRLARSGASVAYSR